MIDRLKYMKNKPSLTGERGRYVFDGTQKKKKRIPPHPSYRLKL